MPVTWRVFIVKEQGSRIKVMGGGDGFDSHPNLAEGLYQPLFLHGFNLSTSTHADIGRFTAGIPPHTHTRTLYDRFENLIVNRCRCCRIAKRCLPVSSRALSFTMRRSWSLVTAHSSKFTTSILATYSSPKRPSQQTAYIESYQVAVKLKNYERDTSFNTLTSHIIVVDTDSSPHSKTYFIYGSKTIREIRVHQVSEDDVR